LDLADRGWGEGGRRGGREARFGALEDYLAQVRAQTIPLGLHTFGVSPDGERLARFTARIAEANDGLSADVVRERLVASGPQEDLGLLRGLSARYVRPGPGNDPVRNPEAIPTGKNFGTFDPRRVPLPSADALGARLAEALVETHRQREGAVPEKVALQLWGVETLRHQGVQEAQGLALLGVRPVRDTDGRITSLERIPREALGRPRVDVVFHATSLYRDTFPMLVELLDRAVRLAAAAPEPDNPVRAHGDALREALIADGMDPAEAERRSLVRIFAEPGGRHDSKLHAMTHASGSWDEEDQVADTYIRRMGHGYGGGLWGEPAGREFVEALSDTDLIVHSRASNLYATLDNDDYFSYGGSIALGVRRANGGGPSPPFFVTDLRESGSERHEPLERFMGQELRARYLNPAFAREMMTEGYAGARHVWKAVDYLWGWQVVVPEVVDAAKWQAMHEVWIEDRYELGIEAFFEEHNPHARQGIAARMLEVVRKGYWEPGDEVLQTLTDAYVDSLVEHGPACDHLTCDNPELQSFVRQTASRVGLDPARVDEALSRIEQAIGRSLDEALTERRADKARWHRPPQSAAAAASEAGAGGAADEAVGRPVTGYRMEEKVVRETEATDLGAPPERDRVLLALAGFAFLLGCGLGGSASRLRAGRARARGDGTGR
ncbi:MAG: cobaltochelatase subunit CobN, partial [bacterium]